MEHTRVMLEDIFGEDLHLKRVRSLAGGVSGVLNATVAPVRYDRLRVSPDVIHTFRRDVITRCRSFREHVITQTAV